MSAVSRPPSRVPSVAKNALAAQTNQAALAQNALAENALDSRKLQWLRMLGSALAQIALGARIQNTLGQNALA